MRAAHTVDQVRAAEAHLMAGLPDGALMQRAAAGLATAVIDLLGGAYGRRVLLLVGPGDNGGDALFAGAMLARRGAAVEAMLVADRVHDAGLAALTAAGGRVVGPADHRPPDVVVDGIVGIGGRPGLRQPALDAVRAVAGVPMVAVDVPSGVDVDTGRLDGTHVTADVTVTFGTHKVCHLVEPAAAACGVVQLVDLGLDLPEAAVTALQAADVAALLPRPEPFAQKYTRGVVGVRAGSERYPGAGVLSTSGAACGLAGMVRYAGGAPDAVRARHPEVVVGAGRVQAWVVGSGGDAEAAEGLAAALHDDVPLVVDADALQHLPAPLGGARPAHPARRRAWPRCSAKSGPRRSRRTKLACARRAARPSRRRGRAAQGPPHPRRRAQRPGPGHHHRYAVARRRRGGRRPRRAVRRAARGRSHAVRRGGRRLLAPRRRGHPRLRRRPDQRPGRRCADPCPG